MVSIQYLPNSDRRVHPPVALVHERERKRRKTLRRYKVSNQSHKKGSFFKYNKCLIITLTVYTVGRRMKDESVEKRPRAGEEKRGKTSDAAHRMCFVVNNEKTIDISHNTINSLGEGDSLPHPVWEKLLRGVKLDALSVTRYYHLLETGPSSSLRFSAAFQKAIWWAQNARESPKVAVKCCELEKFIAARIETSDGRERN